MSAIQRWVERDDARLAQKSTSWFVLRSFLGVLVLEGAQGVRSRIYQKV